MKKKTYGLLALFLVGLLSTGALVSAFHGSNGIWSEEDREELRTAVENDDYNAWKTAMQNRLTEDNFEKVVERRAEMSEKREKREAMRTAIDNADYEAYKTAVENLNPKRPVLSEEVFEKIVETHKLRAEGNHEKAKALRQEVDFLAVGEDMGRGMRKGFARN